MTIKITREGKRFLVAVFIVGFAAFNTGNNLMYLIFSMMFSILILCIIVLFVNLSKINIEFKVEEPIFAFTYSIFILKITNLKKYFPSYSIRFILSGLLSEGIYIDKLYPQESKEIRKKILFQKRGLFTLKSSILKSGFPFIFFYLIHKPSVSSGSTKIVVYPKIYDIDYLMLKDFTKENTGRVLSITGEYMQGIREYKPGDLLKNIHWKATAKRETLMVKEFYRNNPKEITIILDNLLPFNNEFFEKAVSLSASIINEYIQQGYNIRLLTCDKSFNFGSGIEHLYKMLEYLAIVKGSSEINCKIKNTYKEIIILILTNDSSPMKKFVSLAEKVFYASCI